MQDIIILVLFIILFTYSADGSIARWKNPNVA